MPFRVLFVCSGNICRSPTAEAVFRAIVSREGLAHAIEADSAGIGDWHVGEPPDARARAAAAKRGFDLDGLVARQVREDDFATFDLILAMDRSHHDALARLKPDNAPAQLCLFLEYAPALGRLDVPDPYYGARDGFDRVLDMIEEGAAGLLAAIRERSV
jgi:protein-tyrosine phosphatase